MDGAIHRAAGPKLLEACKEIARAHGPLPPGEAVITPGFDMRADFVIHTVGPVYSGGEQGEAETLRSAYAQSLRLCGENGIDSVSFPAISTGAYGYPVDLAAPLALEELRQGLLRGDASLAEMVLHSEADWRRWKETAEHTLGQPETEKDD
ncbi:macro domain-containing protein [Desulfohalovibrio reitneri]|uniref:macro domain-containing protein n=1 Tax=Desulfohalovibrio reitneri TaxID=1307759 RepID=UPI000AD98A01